MVFAALFEPAKGEPVWWQALPTEAAHSFRSVTPTSFGWIAVRGHPGSLGYYESVISVSEDGHTWRQVHREGNQRLHEAAWGEAGGVCVGTTGILFSRSGANWAPVELPVAGGINAVTWFNGRFIAAATGGTLLASSDGITWEATGWVYPGTPRDLFIRGESLVVIGSNSDIFISTDGSAWSAVTPPTTYSFYVGSETLNGMAFSVTTSQAVSGKIVHWSDSGQWTEAQLSYSGGITAMASGPQGTIAVSAGDDVYWSENGSNWQKLREGLLAGAATVANSGDRWLIGAENGALWHGKAKASLRFSTASARFATLAAARHAGTFYAFGHWGVVLQSADGRTWLERLVLDSGMQWRSAVNHNDELLVVGDKGRVLRVDSSGVIHFEYVGTQLVNLHGVASLNGTIVSVGSGGAIYRSGDGISWTGGAGPTSATLRDVTVAGDRFYTVSEAGEIFRSANGVSWELVRTGTGVALNSIEATSSGILAVGAEGQLLLSPDGVDWNAGIVPGELELFTVFETGGLLYAAGESGWLLASSDGLNWSLAEDAIWRSHDIRDVVVTEDTVVAAGAAGLVEGSINISGSSGILLTSTKAPLLESVLNGPARYRLLEFCNGFWWRAHDHGIERSPDGIKWERFEHTLPWPATDIETDGEITVIAGQGGLLVSRMGEDWRPAVLEPFAWDAYTLLPPPAVIDHIARSPDRWFACGDDNASEHSFLVSSDGLHWRRPTDPSDVLPRYEPAAVVWGNGVFVMVCGTKAYVSADADTWQEVALPSTKNVDEVVWTGTWFIAGAPYETLPSGSLIRRFFRSVDGISWEAFNGPPIPNYVTLRIIGNRCFAVGGRESIQSTEDGVNWRVHAADRVDGSGPHTTWNGYAAIDEHDGLWIAAGENGLWTTSSDGDQWTHSPGGENLNFNAIRVVGDRFVALGKHFALSSSPDGIHWTRHNLGSGPFDYLYDVASNGQIAVAVGDQVFVSNDLDHWVAHPLPGGTSMTNIAVHAGAFLAGDQSTNLWRSTDGVNWQSVASASSRFGAVESSGTEVLAASGAGFWRSTDGINWEGTGSFVNGPVAELAWDDRWVAMQESGLLWTSDDGITWNWVAPQPVTGGLPLAATGRLVLGVPDNPLAVRSANDYWDDLGMDWPLSIIGLATKNGVSVAATDKGAILVGFDSPDPAFARMRIAEGASPSAGLSLDADSDGDGTNDGFAHYFGSGVQSQPLSVINVGSVHVDGLSLMFPKATTPSFFLSLHVDQSPDLVSWAAIARKRPWAAWESEFPVVDLGSTLCIGPLVIPQEEAQMFWRLRVSEE